MIKECLCLLLLLLGCHSKTEKEEFQDRNLLFDLETESVQYDCPIQGTIPQWLSGTLLRNGPAKFTAGGKRVTSWFDGLAMIHAFSFTPDKVIYSNRFLRSDQYYTMVVEKSLDFSGFAQDPCGKAFKNQSSKFIPEEMKDVHNAVVSIANYADQMVALTENPLPVVFDRETLATVGVFNYQDDLPKEQIFESAHPQFDGETINYLVQFGRKSSYEIWKMKQDATREKVASIPVDLPSYMHSFALTEHYVILVEYPFVVNPIDLIKEHKPFIANFKWKPERGTTFIIVERSSGKVIHRVKTDPFFAFHHVNAYEHQGKIIMDIITYPDASIIQLVAGKGLNYTRENPKLERFTLAHGRLTRETTFEKPLEMPRVPARLTARPYQYCYAIDYRFPNSEKDQRAIYKVHASNGKHLSWEEPGCFPGEPIFVPRPGSQKEDDGVVLSLVLDFAHHQSFLLILNAEDFKELARARSPHAIPVGLHGLWDQR